MATRAFILVETQVGRAQQVVRELRALDGVEMADMVTGTVDIIALVEGADMGAIAGLVTGRVQGIRGVMRTITCVAAA